MKKKVVRPLKRAIVKEEYVAITGDILEAIVLNQMIYWSQRVNDYDKLLEEEKERRAQEAADTANMPFLFGWIHKSAIELKDEIMCGDSAKTIMRKLNGLVGKGFLDRRNNPDHPYDRIYQYRVNFNAVTDALDEYGYSLDGFKVETVLPKNESNEKVQPENVKQLPENRADYSKGQIDECKGQNVLSKGQIDLWKGQNDACNGHGVPAIPETTTEITSEITLSSPSYSPKPGKKPARTEDKAGAVSEILTAVGVDKLRHREMIEPIMRILSDLLCTGKVGRNQFRTSEIQKAVCNLTADDIDGIIDRFAGQEQKNRIPCPEDYLKTCLLHAGQAAEYRTLAVKSGADSIHCGKPSFDVDDYVALQMKCLHEEGEN